MTDTRRDTATDHRDVSSLLTAARRFWTKIHREGLCPHDPNAWSECDRLRDELDEHPTADPTCALGGQRSERD